MTNAFRCLLRVQTAHSNLLMELTVFTDRRTGAHVGVAFDDWSWHLSGDIVNRFMSFSRHVKFARFPVTENQALDKKCKTDALPARALRTNEVASDCVQI